MSQLLNGSCLMKLKGGTLWFRKKATCPVLMGLHLCRPPKKKTRWITRYFNGLWCDILSVFTRQGGTYPGLYLMDGCYVILFTGGYTRWLPWHLHRRFSSFTLLTDNGSGQAQFSCFSSPWSWRGWELGRFNLPCLWLDIFTQELKSPQPCHSGHTINPGYSKCLI